MTDSPNDSESGVHRRLSSTVTDADIADQLAEVDPNSLDADEEKRVMQLRERFIKKYQAASIAYLRSKLKDSDVTNEVWHDFVTRWLEGRLSTYDSEAGSFRRYMMTSLKNSVAAHWRRQGRGIEKRTVRLADNHEIAQPGSDDDAASDAFYATLSSQVLNRAFYRLEAEDTLQYEVMNLLRQASVDPDADGVTTKMLAEHLGNVSNCRVSEDNAKKIKQRAKERYWLIVIDEIVAMTGEPGVDAVTSTLADLKLLRYSGRGLEQYRKMRGE
ncbi:MAG: hypothetical protein AAGJ46_10095 [Planctomycetota bacterium]